MNYSLGHCIGVCLKDASNKQYIETLDEIVKLFNGTDKSIIEQMEYMMNSALEKFDFENAAKYRDYISAVNYLINNAKIIEFSEANQNIALLEYLKEKTFKLFLIKGNKVLFSEKYNINDFDLQELISIMKSNILLYFNANNTAGPIEISRDEIDEAQIIYSYLKTALQLN